MSCVVGFVSASGLIKLLKAPCEPFFEIFSVMRMLARHCKVFHNYYVLRLWSTEIDEIFKVDNDLLRSFY